MHSLLTHMSERVAAEALDGDVAHFKGLLRKGELITKLTVVTSLALLDDRNGPRFRYAAEFSLVRAQGIGAWSFELQRLMTGPGKTSFRHSASPIVAEVTQRFSNSSDSWQAESLRRLNLAERALNAAPSARTEKTAMIAFFTRFANIRNKYDHGSQLLSQVSEAGRHLSESLDIVVENSRLLQIPWCVAITTFSGKRRLHALADASVKVSGELPTSGTFLAFDDTLFPLNLVNAIGNGEEVFFANGQFNSRDATYEGLSYLTGLHTRLNGSMYINEPQSLASSESEGLPQLDLQGETWGNLPPAKDDYVRRVDIEAELIEELVDSEVDPIITLGGPGGIGKTSTALEVLHKIADRGDFDLILWFSARDVDLLDAEGAVAVRPKVLSFADAAQSYAHLVAEMGYDVSNTEAAFTNALRGTADRTLFVFDNFETILEPTTLFNTLKSHLRLPNKLLITTRFTDFKGQYPIDIRGMAFAEFQNLVSSTASRLGIVHLVLETPDYVRSLHRETFGHPYVVKIVLGEIARDGRIRHVERILAKRDDILDALFQRSFERLSLPAQRTFLLLCSWRSIVPLVALDAVQRRSGNAENIDVEAAVEELAVSSMVEILRPNEKEDPRWVNVPAAAFKFGSGRVRHHSYTPEILADSKYLRLLGPLKTVAIDAETLDLTYFFARSAEALAAQSLAKDQVLDVTMHLARAVPGAWRSAARALHRVDERAALKALTFGPPRPEDWPEGDLRLRYEVLRALSHPIQTHAGLDLLGRYAEQGQFNEYSRLLYELATGVRLRQSSLSHSQKERVVSELLQEPRRYQDLLDEPTSIALASLSASLGLRSEQQAWTDQANYIRSIRGPSGSANRYSTKSDDWRPESL
jgi:hypothetical protein